MVGALGAAILLAACTGSSGHASNQSSQPPSPTAPPTPSPTPLSVAAYFRAVDALLTRSAALRPRIVAAEAAAESGDQQALQAAHGTLIRALLSHQISLATVQSLQAPSEARAVNGQLASALQATRGFAAYWRVIYPGSALIRRMWQRAIKQRAEQPDRP